MTILPERPSAVLDTNVASFFFGRKLEAKLYEDDCKDRLLYLSFQTVGEMLAGAEMAEWGERRRDELAEFLSRYEPIYPDDENKVVETWATMSAAMKKKGKTLKLEDSWIAATALATGRLLIAHDKAFKHVPGLKLMCHAPGV